MADKKIQRNCTLCGNTIKILYFPMEEWGIGSDKPLCSGCYSKKIHEFYPGKHERMEGRDAGDQA